MHILRKNNLKSKKSKDLIWYDEVYYKNIDRINIIVVFAVECTNNLRQYGFFY